MAEYARAFAGVHLIGTVAGRADQLRQCKYPGPGGEEPAPEELASRMAAVVADFRAELLGVYARGLATASPLAEALAEGKVDKAERLLAAGAGAAVSVEGGGPSATVDLRALLPEGSDEYRSFERAFGRYVWRELAMQMLAPPGGVALSCSTQRGSALLGSPYARDRALHPGLNLAERKGMEERYAALLRRLEQAEREAFGPAPAPRAAGGGGCEAEVGQVLNRLRANPASKLLEEAVIAQRPGSVHATARPAPKKTHRRTRSGIGSEVLSLLLGFEDGEGADGGVEAPPADEAEAAAQVSRVESGLRMRRSQARGSAMEEFEGWGDYKRRTMSVAFDSDEDFDI